MLCFALLAHKDEHALKQQIRNIRKYNGRSVKIVLYNGGRNPDFGKRVCRDEHVMYCPYSRPLRRGKTGRFYYDVMRWLEEKRVAYDYLVYTEHDVFFVNRGFEKLLRRHLNGYDFIGKYYRTLTNPKTTEWEPGITMWKEWSRWKPFFRSVRFYGTFNPMQVYRHQIVKRMLSRINKRKLETLFRTTKVYALGEILYITLAVLCGGKGRHYPWAAQRYLYFAPRITINHAVDAKKNQQIMFVHPVKDAVTRNWICNH